MYQIEPYPGHDAEITLPTTMYKMDRLVPEYFQSKKSQVRPLMRLNSDASRARFLIQACLGK